MLCSLARLDQLASETRASLRQAEAEAEALRIEANKINTLLREKEAEVESLRSQLKKTNDFAELIRGWAFPSPSPESPADGEE